MALARGTFESSKSHFAHELCNLWIGSCATRPDKQADRAASTWVVISERIATKVGSDPLYHRTSA